MLIPWPALPQQQSGLEPNRFGGLLGGLNQSSSGWKSVELTGTTSKEKSFTVNHLWNSVDFLGR